MTCRISLFALSILLLTPPVSAQDAHESPTTDPVEAARDVPIIVTALPKEETRQSNSASRIPKKPRFTNQNVRSETGIAGLTPGSGMTPFAGENRTHRLRTVTCVGESDGEALGERAACLIWRAQEDITDGEVGLAKDVYRYLASSPDFTPAERLAGGNLLYELGVANEDDALREEALIRLLDAEALQGREATSARRTLVAMALKRKDNVLTIERLEDVVTYDPQDSRSLANLAVLMRQEGRDGAEVRMEQAIAAREANGSNVPKGWRDFLSLGS
ncbi:hypothetical protein [Parerythrobacter aestuarii]|uniref:hypothetical protein n=1 Tax=Parerythrobacter aestuarii TaxID=3020909 RepID=UPI0024DE5CA7|nr:hypothetical protein [Parerythrobacter aestuarii]